MRYLLFLFIILINSTSTLAQNSTLGYGVETVSRSIQKGKLTSAKVISDINPRYEAAWVREYISVKLTVSCEEEKLEAIGNDFAFNEEQLRILSLGNTGGEVKVVVQYYPDNQLRKEEKEMDFTLTIAPDIDAKFKSGDKELRTYLRSHSIDRLDEITSKKVHQARVGFTVNANGEVVKVKTTERSFHAAVDSFLLDMVNNMPNWTAAENADGQKVPQDFEFILTGDRCVYSHLHDN